MKKLLGPHLFLPSLFVCLGMITIVLNIKVYNRHDIYEAATLEHTTSPGLSLQDLRSMFDSPAGHAAEKYEIIARKNLFSQDRRYREPALPGKDNEAVEKTARVQRVDTNSFKLYGTTISRNSKVALIYCREHSGSRYLLVREGEVVFNSRDGRKAYEVVSIQEQSVVLRADDETFEISLNDLKQDRGLKTGLFGSALVIGGEHEVFEDDL